MKTVIWFRRDLRLQDNPALSAAVASGLPVEAVFVYPQLHSALSEGAAARWYLHHSLLDLYQRLARLGIRLHFLYGPIEQELVKFCSQIRARNLFWNRLLDPAIEAAEKPVRETLNRSGVSYRIFDDDCLVMPEDAMKKDGTAYRVFTPFWKHLKNHLLCDRPRQRLMPAPRPVGAAISADQATLDRLGLLPDQRLQLKLQPCWQPGERNALVHLHQFLNGPVAGYDKLRELPAQPGTSRLSAALHFGELSVVNVYAEARLRQCHEMSDTSRLSIRRFLTEIGWREFARHVLHAFPHSAERSMNPLFDHATAWESDPGHENLNRWKHGETGIALVDAGMRELWQTGWMHNRVRMVVASFLTKNLGIHWREGANWFADTLVDADRASNTLGWQWVAGCGTDAAPYYRIFNADIQAEKFDPKRAYIHRWSSDCDNSVPITDLKLSRVRALERYRRTVQSTPA